MTSYDPYKEGSERLVNNEFPWLIKLLEECFDFKRRGFQMIYSGLVPYSDPIIVYESKIGRVRFSWMVSADYDPPEKIVIKYGRLHAPIFQNTMEWNGEKCDCWHLCHDALDFLAGLTPQESRKKGGAFLGDFYDANKDKEWREAEYYVRREAAIWEHYGQRLLDIFDLNHPDLWDQYTNFLKERHYIGQSSNLTSFFHKVC